MPINDRITFRSTPDDIRHIETLGATLKSTSSAAFITRTDVVRTALRLAVQATSAPVGQASAF